MTRNPQTHIKLYEDVNVKLSSKQWTKNEVSEPIHLMTRGTLTRNEDDKLWSLTYNESSDDGMEEVTSTLYMFDVGGIRLERVGALEMDIHFEKGKHYISAIFTPFGRMDVSFFTNEALSEMSETGGTIDLSYAMTLRQRETMSTQIHIEVKIVS